MLQKTPLSSGTFHMLKMSEYYIIYVSQSLIHLPTLSTECKHFFNSLEERSRNTESMASPSWEEKEQNFYAGLGSFKAVLFFVN